MDAPPEVRSERPGVGVLIAAALVVVQIMVIAFVPWPRGIDLPLGFFVTAARAIPGIAAFVVVGAAVRPRGRVGLGVLLGASVYLVIGAIATVAVNAAAGIPLGDLGPLPIWQVIAWPELIAVFATGGYRF